MSKSREQLNKFLSKIDITDRVVLDVGVQDKPTSRLTKGNARLYHTMDIDPQWEADITADLNDPKTVWKIATENSISYDTIFCIEVLEHCWNPVQCVANLADLLAPGGKLYLSTPFINPHHDYFDYLRYTNEWFRDVLPKVGFSDVQIHERVATTGQALLQGFYKLEGLRVSKIRPEHGRYTYPIGYFVEATK